MTGRSLTEKSIAASVLRAVLVTVPAPQRYHKAIPFFPVKLFTVDHCGPAAPEGMVDGTAVVSVGMGCLTPS